MSKIIWDKTGERFYETGVEKGVLYPMIGGTYGVGVAWDGLTSVNENPSGAEVTPLYADNIKYLNLISAEEFGFTIEAYMSPPEFDACDGTSEIATGVSIGQQKRSQFGFSYVSRLGNDTEGTDNGYKLHLIYNALASPSGKDYSSINNSPEAMTLSWECSTTPIEVDGYKPTACVTINSTTVDATKLAALEKILYGDEESEARLLLPSEIIALMTDETSVG
jgi:hypothetical protein